MVTPRLILVTLVTLIAFYEICALCVSFSMVIWLLPNQKKTAEIFLMREKPVNDLRYGILLCIVYYIRGVPYAKF